MANSRVGSYDHLKSGHPITIDLDALAAQIAKSNYGPHRMVSALIRAMRSEALAQEEEFDIKYPNTPNRDTLDFKSQLAERLAEVLESGVTM